MKKLFLFLIVIFLLGAGVNGHPVPKEKALIVAQNFMNSKTGNVSKTLSYISLSLQGEEEINTFYVFVSEGNGFVIVAADDAVQPILAYAVNNAFLAGPAHSPEVNYWLNGYDEQIKHVVENDIIASEEVSGMWNYWLNRTDNASALRPTNIVDPLLTTTWDQTTFYNALCPGTGNNKAPTGCVATAMAQIMKYWNAPTEGVGSNSYNSRYGLLSADFANTNYEWDLMPNRVVNSSHADAKHAVATLMYHCGVSVNMDYAPSASGAHVIARPGYASAELAFKNNFAYKNTIKGYSRFRFAEADWMALLKEEIDSKRPILYAGYGVLQGAQVGHAFVFDGYDENDFFHVNWGWGGASDGYFTINSLAPSVLGTGAGAGNFNDNQQALMHIEPISRVSIDYQLQIDADLALSKNKIEVGDSFSVTAIIKNVGNASFYGNLQVQIYEAQTDKQVVAPIRYMNQIIRDGDDTTMYFMIRKDIPALTPGEYYLKINFADINTPVEWQDLNDQAGLSKVASFTVFKEEKDDDDATGIKNRGNMDAVIYPNPAKDFIHIDLGASMEVNAVELYNIKGQRIFSENPGQKKMLTISVGQLPAGIYVLQLHSQEGVPRNKKVVISK